MTIAASPGIYRTGLPNGNYTITANDFGRSDLPSRAVKVGLYLLGHAEGFQQTQVQIARAIRLAVRTVAAALRDLTAAGYLKLVEVRNHLGHRIGTRYEITDSPQPVDNPVDQAVDDLGKSLTATSASALYAAPKKTKPRRGFRQKTKKNPSGGRSAAAAPPTLDTPIAEEAPMKIADEPLTLFDAPEKPKRQGQPRPLSAQTVVAAYVEAYRRYHSGGDPVKSAIGRVARDAAVLLRTGDAGPDELASAAMEMGSGPYTNLAMALQILRDRRPGRHQGFAPASPHTDPYWQDIEQGQQARWVEKILTDDMTRDFVLQDPVEVERLCAAHPELAGRLGRVA